MKALKVTLEFLIIPFVVAGIVIAAVVCFVWLLCKVILSMTEQNRLVVNCEGRIVCLDEHEYKLSGN